MEYSYRCSRCGRRTPSFDYEDDLKDYAIDWKISENETLCDKCASGKNEEFIKKMNRIELIVTAIIVLLFAAFIYLTHLTQ